MNIDELVAPAFGVWLCWIGVNALVARAKNFSVGGVVALSVLLTPLFVYLYIAAVPPASPKIDPYA